MKERIRFNIFFCLALGAALGFVSYAEGQSTCMGFTCTITGDSGANTLNGTSGVDVMCGLGGNDTISGAGGADKICGGSGDDTLNGGQGNDLIDGENGADLIDGDEDTDTAVFIFAIQATLADGADGSTNNGDTLRDIENLSGSSGDDILTGNSGANTLLGQAGNDILRGMGGADPLDGGNGTDTAEYFSAITATLGSTASDGDSLTNIENLTGSSSGDILTGDNNNNVLNGGSGVDQLNGSGGTDTCNGGLPIGQPPGEGEDPDTCTACESTSGCTVP